MPGLCATFTAASRRELLDELFVLSDRIDATLAGESPAAEDLARYGGLRRAYRELLPKATVARCPFTQQVYEHSLDWFGIDGPWWDCRAANRPLELMMTGTVLAFTGALSMTSPIERTPFLVKPGPGAPFVVPRLLARQGVRAVVSSLSIGAHTGYVITYFANPAPDDLEGFNDWGTDYYQFDDGFGQLGWHQGSDTAVDHDFELAPYLKSGQLLWIAPGDATMTLREGASGCPYVDLKGCRLPQLVQNGERWLGEFPIEDILDVDQEDAPVSAPSSSSMLMPAGLAAAEPQPVPPVMPDAASSATSPVRRVVPVSAALSPATASTAPSFCGKCGTPHSPNARFCGGCGGVLRTS
jgi:hypothetical protein